jgi:hypothetical protein
MATPEVAGVAGLVLAAEPNISMKDLRERLLNSIDPLPSRGQSFHRRTPQCGACRRRRISIEVNCLSGKLKAFASTKDARALTFERAIIAANLRLFVEYVIIYVSS